MSSELDVGVIGGGIVGLATAFRLLQRFGDRRVILWEKEDRLAAHQTGRNSGVLHSGIYYRPGSLKARNCRAGKEAMVAFCEAEGIEYELCGKVIVAVDESEVSRLEEVYSRGQQNGVRCELIGPERLAELEPHAAGVRAIHVPETGIVDYAKVCARLAERIEEGGGQIRRGAEVRRVLPAPRGWIVETTAGEHEVEYLISCAGLHADRVARNSGVTPAARIVPFRGEYFELAPSARHLCRTLIYPTPDPRLPFLGVHLTKMIDGSRECGPNAVFAFAREGYEKTDVALGDLFDALTFPGTWRVMRRYWRVGAHEMWRSMCKRAFVRALQRLVPELTSDDLTPAPAGVRAQAVLREGELADDFLLEVGPRAIHVINAPSPAATASLNIADHIVTRYAG